MQKFILYILLVTSVFSFVNPQNGYCDSVADSLELVNFYNVTNGPNWTNTWDLSQPMSTWYGVGLNADGCVTCLDLDGNRHNGHLKMMSQEDCHLKMAVTLTLVIAIK